ncbi:hypothetical protein [Kitasatospora sp. NPDC057738]|uniref:hypothetical protein n=1 Tax=Kitasatospora sp. NPDC057738 TaxID=3346233 RepID=UPI0036C014B3
MVDPTIAGLAGVVAVGHAGLAEPGEDPVEGGRVHVEGQVMAGRVLDGHEVQGEGVVDPHRREVPVGALVVEAHDGGEESC